MALGDIKASYSCSNYVNAFDYFKDGSKIVTNDYEDAVIWDIEKNEIIARITHPNGVNDVKLSNDETRVVSCDNDSVIVWDVNTEEVITTFTDHNDYVKKVTISNDDNKVISASGSEIYVWEIETEDILVTFDDYTMGIYALDISPDGTQIVSGGYDQKVQVWDIETGDIIQNISDAHSGTIFSLDFHPDGDKVLSGGDDDTIKLWEISSGDLLQEFTYHTDRVNSCRFFPEGNMIVSCGNDYQLFIWDIEKDTELYNKAGYEPYDVEAAACNKNGSEIAVGYGYDAEVIELIDPSGLILISKSGQVYNNDPDYLQVPLSLGRVLITEESEVCEVQFENNKELPIKNVSLSASDEKTGTDLTFSKTLSPFDDLQSVTYDGPYEPGEKDTFYIRLNTDLEAAKGEDSLLINADAEFAY